MKGPNLKKNTPGLDRPEFARQLENQQQGLNRLTVAEFLANRRHYDALRKLKGTGRDPKGDAAQKVAREEALADKIAELQLLDAKLSDRDAATQAQGWLSTQAALHDPDQVAGGHSETITGMGDARVNSSIGAQWPKRIKGLEAAIKKQAAGLSPQQQATTYLHVLLPFA
ncbi:MAG: hypothetical protein EOO55_04735 [Hymenobacter sp.]|nr:MAG: hypothetical protein EOO55_04735 [Hymenobacter sp.]